MKKIFFKLFLFITIIMNITITVFAENIKLCINDKFIETDVNPKIYNNRTYVPIRIISEELGYNVEWLENTKEIKINNNSNELILKINSKYYLFNGNKEVSDVEPIIENNRTLVPIRLIAEKFNKTVDWDKQNKTVIIKENNINENNNIVYEEAIVTKVIDGDTIQVNINGDLKNVRLIGVNTPETKHPKKEIEYYGEEASNFTTKELTGKTVFLQKDVSEVDKYNRLLRFVWLAKPINNIPTKEDIENNMFNAILLKNGYANVSTYPPDISYQEIFLNLEKYAKENNLGLWANENNKKS